jgi:hypothetical protein
VLLHDFAYYGEAQACSVRSLCTYEWLEDLSLIGRRYAWSGIAYLDSLERGGDAQRSLIFHGVGGVRY